ncbi:phospholipase D family protein [Phytohalomonas tamaricis]|uniref:phospholipase D family protein n=1 Tax=Phytohalomonas tamaricis TaxID=2081032 RepID=UPI001319CAF8|nr:phospholipase D family protein [Phytohalomonas tamaricis]
MVALAKMRKAAKSGRQRLLRLWPGTDRPRRQTPPPSHALSEIATAATPLGHWTDSRSPHGADTGFMLMTRGAEAFALRAELAQRSTQTLDIQTYIFEDGLTSRLLLDHMLVAAQRGVRVRFLIDDLTIGDQQTMLAALNSHPNIEVRVFNPILYGRRHIATRRIMLVLGCVRLHRRMHNKLWIADNAMGITGGRNLSDDYFSADADHEFADLDILAAGQTVSSLSQSFDDYWNHTLAKSLAWFESAAHDAWQALRDTLKQQLDQELRERVDYSGALDQLNSHAFDELAQRLCWAKGRVVWDSPDKLMTWGRPVHERLLIDEIAVEFSRIKQRLFAISGYFVPRQLKCLDISALLQRDVEVTVVTNALEATDVALVHGGYAPCRVPLLSEGIQLHELRSQPASMRRRLPQARSTSLHAKAIALDNDRVIIGSFNLDPRSVWWNSEVALVVESTELNQRLCELGSAVLAPERSYRVTLDADNKLQWFTRKEGRDCILARDPGSRWRHLQAWVSAKVHLYSLL